MYKIVRNLLFLFPPEWVHYFSMNCFKALCNIGIIRSLIRASLKPASFRHPIVLETKTGLLQVINPVGLGAGFDKNARYLRELDCMGFGFVEIGTVTPKPQSGNDKPRLFRLKRDLALINRMGFNNDGVDMVKKRLATWRKNNPHSPLLIGGNIGKNKVTENEAAWKDYVVCFEGLFDFVDYFVVNVSSPNTPGLRALQEKDSLRKILVTLQQLNQQKTQPKPIFLKIAPDLTPGQIDDVAALALEINLDGIVATNTTIDRAGLCTPEKEIESIGAGGLSGKPVQKKSTEVLRQIVQKTGAKIPIIASGGIFTRQDAEEKLNEGAKLVQVWTGFIYEGPAIVKKICKNLILR